MSSLGIQKCVFSWKYVFFMFTSFGALLIMGYSAYCVGKAIDFLGKKTN